MWDPGCLLVLLGNEGAFGGEQHIFTFYFDFERVCTLGVDAFASFFNSRMVVSFHITLVVGGIFAGCHYAYSTEECSDDSTQQT